MVYTDDASAYGGMRRRHETVNHSAGEYVRGMAHTNGMESFWAMLRRGHIGTYHKMSWKHLDRYIREFVGRHNDRPLDAAAQLSRMACGVIGKQLRYSGGGISSGEKYRPRWMCARVGYASSLGELSEGRLTPASA